VLFRTKAREAGQHRRRNPAWKPIYMTTLRGLRAVALMRMLRPLMGKRRQEQIDAALDARAKAMTRSSNRALTKELRREIARRLDAGESARELMVEYAIPRESVYRAARRGRIE
jgi:hypothetical protein